MNVDLLIISVVIVLFPILVNVLHDLYVRNSDKDKNDLFLDIALISSLYLFNALNHNHAIFFIIVNTILLISLIKKRYLTSSIISLFFVITYSMNGTFNGFMIVLQYIVLYLLYFILSNRKKETLFIYLFILIKIAYILEFYIKNNSLVEGIIVSIIFCLMTYLIIYVIKISEDIVALNMSLKELQKEKRIRESLFKITHEIKNPIAVCKSYLDMFDFNNPEHERYIGILKEEMNNILDLLKDFANMGKIEIECEIFDINMLLEEVIRQSLPILKNDNIEFITEVSDDELYFEGDYNRLRQVLTNFLKNAKEAKDENKKSYIGLKTKIEKKNFIIAIEDNGIGMDEETLGRVTELFYTTKKNGTGLGVPLSCEIVRAHKGNVTFESKENEWTKVTVELPIGDIEF